MGREMGLLLSVRHLLECLGLLLPPDYFFLAGRWGCLDELCSCTNLQQRGTNYICLESGYAPPAELAPGSLELSKVLPSSAQPEFALSS